MLSRWVRLRAVIGECSGSNWTNSCIQWNEEKNPLVLLWTTDKLLPVFCLRQNVLFPLPQTKTLSNHMILALIWITVLRLKVNKLYSVGVHFGIYFWNDINLINIIPKSRFRLMSWSGNWEFPVPPLILLCSAPPYSCSCQICRPFYHR